MNIPETKESAAAACSGKCTSRQTARCGTERERRRRRGGLGGVPVSAWSQSLDRRSLHCYRESVCVTVRFFYGQSLHYLLYIALHHMTSHPTAKRPWDVERGSRISKNLLQGELRHPSLDSLAQLQSLATRTRCLTCATICGGHCRETPRGCLVEHPPRPPALCNTSIYTEPKSEARQTPRLRHAHMVYTRAGRPVDPSILTPMPPLLAKHHNRSPQCIRLGNRKQRLPTCPQATMTHHELNTNTKYPFKTHMPHTHVYTLHPEDAGAVLYRQQGQCMPNAKHESHSRRAFACLVLFISGRRENTRPQGRYFR